MTDNKQKTKHLFIVDDATQRLMDLTAESDRSEDDVDEIISLVQEKAPKLLEGLTESNKKKIGSDLFLKCYECDEVVFQQDDPPDAYYTVIRGAVSIYALNSSTTSNSDDERGDRCKYGKFLMQLPPGASFGELSFNANYKHSSRSAGVVSDGSHGQSRVQLQTPGIVTQDFSGSNETEASNVAVLLLIPEKTYMSELYTRHTSKHQTKDKIAFLKASFLFNQWSMDQLVKMAYAMKKKQFVKGSTIVHQGDRADLVWIIKKGKMAVIHKMSKPNGKKTPLSNDSAGTDIAIDIAELSTKDIFGLVEVFGNHKKMKREATALCPLEVYIVPTATFISFLDQEQRTAALLEKVVQKRIKWEILRKDYASKFPTMPFSLPPDAERMSKYGISKESAMSDQELKARKEKDLILFRNMREARSCYRNAISKAKLCNHKGAAEEMKKAKEFCIIAKTLAEEISDGDKKEQAKELLEETMDQERHHLQLHLESIGVSVEMFPKSSPGLSVDASARRGSVALVALRIRELEEIPRKRSIRKPDKQNRRESGQLNGKKSENMQDCTDNANSDTLIAASDDERIKEPEKQVVGKKWVHPLMRKEREKTLSTLAKKAGIMLE